VTAVVLVGGPADGRTYEMREPLLPLLRIPIEPPARAVWCNDAELPAAIDYEIATYRLAKAPDYPHTGRLQYVHG
jgi:hypothetical protein